MKSIRIFLPIGKRMKMLEKRYLITSLNIMHISIMEHSIHYQLFSFS